MKSIKIKTVRLADQRLQNKNTGRSNEFASKLKMSESNLFYLMKLLKDDLNAPIVFDRKLKSYKYAVKGSIVIAFVREEDI